MNRIQTLAAALLVATLPLAPAAFASDRGHDDHDRSGYSRHDHGYRHHHGHRWHHRHGHHYGHYDDRGYDRHARVVLPMPPLPPFPVIVLDKRHH